MSLFITLFEPPPVVAPVKSAYRKELITEATLPMCFAVMEGGFAGVIAAKLFAASPLVIAVIAAAPMFSNLSSFAWARLIRGKPKVKILFWIQSAILLFTGLIALTPSPEDGGIWMLVTCILVVRLLMSGQITARSLVWSLNYGRDVRARITGRLTIVSSLAMVLVATGGGLLMDASPESFRWVFAGAAIFGMVGVNAFSRVTVQGEKEFLQAERDAAETSSVGMWQVLRRDKKFREYQVYQFLAGTSNMMLEAPVIYLVSNQLGASYITSITLTLILPFTMSLATLPFWAGYLDNNHVTLFRARQSALWVLSQIIMFFGAIFSSLWVLALGRVVLGITRGGGSLAWTLGHNDFAKPTELGVYMGAHVTLTGIRGAFAPFVGILLYLGWDSAGILPSYEGLGAGVFLVAAALSSLSWLGYQRMKQSLTEELKAGGTV
ncbi:MAG: hypothetical protein ACJAX5_000272 [Patiriisocius sp.]|jgi:hypothetical protein